MCLGTQRYHVFGLVGHASACPLSPLFELSAWVVDETWQYSAAGMERMMKVQDVLLKTIAKED
jgi:hypothetical protein